MFTLLSLGLGLWSACHAIMYKRDPRSATIWVFLSFLLPIVGPWAYWAMGINRIERKAMRRFGSSVREFDPEGRPTAGEHRFAEGSAFEALKTLRAVADRVTELPLLSGNRITPLHNGEEAYPQMLEAIREAKKSVTLLSYIMDWDDIGREFAEALDQAAARGVTVLVLVDGIGALGQYSRMGRKLLEGGAKVSPFFPLRFPLGRFRIHLRNHRKILVVDGRVGFTGGMNISARHMVGRGRRDAARDLHFRAEGPVVSELQHVFVEDWALVTGEELSGDAYFPKLEAVGDAVCRGVASGPDRDFEKVHWIMQAALAAAEKRVWLLTPYFVPTWPLIAQLSIAAMRGVDVRVVLPSTSDLFFMRWAADAYLWQLLQYGVRVFHWPPPFVHTKLMLVDDQWVFMGSANCDRRSFRLNFEFNVEVYDAEMAKSLGEWIEGEMPNLKEITLDEIDARPMWRRLRDGFVKLFSPYL